MLPLLSIKTGYPSDHRGVVCTPTWRRKIETTALCSERFSHALSERSVTSHPSRQYKILEALALERAQAAIYQLSDGRSLKAGEEIVERLTLRQLSLLLEQRQHRCLEAAKAKVRAAILKARQAEAVSLGIALLSKALNYGTTGIAQPQHPRHFIKGLSSSVVSGVGDLMKLLIHTVERCVSSADSQGEIGRRWGLRLGALR